MVVRQIELGRIAGEPRGTDRPFGGELAPRKWQLRAVSREPPVARGTVVGVGVLAGHRFCADAVVEYDGEGTPGGCPGSSGIPPPRARLRRPGICWAALNRSAARARVSVPPMKT
jgi:hypothetical protein